MKTTFLRASNGLSLSKHYENHKFTPYPHVRAVTSHTYDIPVNTAGLNELEDLIRYHASCGDCMLKGNLRRDIIDESRAGQTDKKVA